jgi:hypothetical protein
MAMQKRDKRICIGLLIKIKGLFQINVLAPILHLSTEKIALLYYLHLFDAKIAPALDDLRTFKFLPAFEQL